MCALFSEPRSWPSQGPGTRPGADLRVGLSPSLHAPRAEMDSDRSQPLKDSALAVSPVDRDPKA